MSSSEPTVIVQTEGTLGRIRLNRPKALNSLTLEMVRKIADALDHFETDACIAAVLLTGEGDRGLCAGGDIRAIYESGRGDGSLALAFWREQYILDSRIAHFGKPYIAVMDGLTMGGGVGLSAHGSIRLVTERTHLAMPETGIGYFPDVGGTWLLSHAPGESGTYLGLTGEPVGAADAIFSGLADLCVPSANIAALIAALATSPSEANSSSIKAIVDRFATTPAPGPLQTHRNEIDTILAADDVETIFLRLRDANTQFLASIEASLRAKSPLSLKLTLRLLRLGRTSQNLEVCLDREFAADHKILLSHDFYEGIRAAVIDKDRQPRWCAHQPSDVPDEMIDAYLTPIQDPIFGPQSSTKGDIA
jgi:enoyl-CoA hydratase